MAFGISPRKRRDEREPTIPKETCPKIDATLDLLADVEKSFEALRESNSDLREALTYWKERAEEAEEREAQLERQIENMREAA